MAELTEDALRAELAQLEIEIPQLSDQLQKLRWRHQQLAELFPRPETPAPRIVAPSVAIGY